MKLPPKSVTPVRVSSYLPANFESKNYPAEPSNGLMLLPANSPRDSDVKTSYLGAILDSHRRIEMMLADERLDSIVTGEGDTDRMIEYLRRQDKKAPISKTIEVTPRGDIEFSTRIPYKPPKP